MDEKFQIILDSKETSKDMKLMSIVHALAEKQITKINAYRLLSEHKIFSKSFFKIDTDCAEFIMKNKIAS